MTYGNPSQSVSPQSRYVLPNFEEKTSYGTRTLDPYSKLFEQRIIFLGTGIDDVAANDIMSQLLILEQLDSESDITLYINSPGGSMTALTAILDTMRYIPNDITTICLGQAASAAAVLLAGGTSGKRMALPNARIMIHQPSINGGGRGQASDIAIHAEEIIRMSEWLVNELHETTGQDLDILRKDLDRDKFLTAEMAKDYGIVDHIIPRR